MMSVLPTRVRRWEIKTTIERILSSPGYAEKPGRRTFPGGLWLTVACSRPDLAGWELSDQCVLTCPMKAHCGFLSGYTRWTFLFPFLSLSLSFPGASPRSSSSFPLLLPVTCCLTESEETVSLLENRWSSHWYCRLIGRVYLRLMENVD